MDDFRKLSYLALRTLVVLISLGAYMYAKALRFASRAEGVSVE